MSLDKLAKQVLLKEDVDREAKKNDCSRQDALRDILTDYRHLADREGLSFKSAAQGSKEVFQEEIKLEKEGADKWTVYVRGDAGFEMEVRGVTTREAWDKARDQLEALTDEECMKRAKRIYWEVSEIENPVTDEGCSR